MCGSSMHSQIGPQAVPQLTGALGSEDSSVRVGAARVLGNLGSSSREAAPGSSTCWRMNQAAYALRPAPRLAGLAKPPIRKSCRAFRQKVPKRALPPP